eukprot:TRINITY_DN14108_c0_g1_i1.p1 TRINITY_DN14108_c0_g1~~TRINITY_DN14108_c0_g1_i1.p1  ORF type:complete len:276 (+),score=83.72 TRINITY_DN14108_c0_g1_i1:100-927(+)
MPRKSHQTMKRDAKKAELAEVDEATVIQWLQRMLQRQVITSDLPEFLHDGVALSECLNVVQPEAVADLNRPKKGKTLAHQQCIENVNKCVEVLRTLGVPDAVLFEPADLVERKNLPQVYHAICAIAEVGVARGVVSTEDPVFETSATVVADTQPLAPEPEAPAEHPVPADDTHEDLRARVARLEVQLKNEQEVTARQHEAIVKLIAQIEERTEIAKQVVELRAQLAQYRSAMPTKHSENMMVTAQLSADAVAESPVIVDAETDEDESDVDDDQQF